MQAKAPEEGRSQANGHREAGMYYDTALRWTVDNAEKFGGNAASVVLLGHGAGAVSIGLHLMSPIWQRSLANISRLVLMGGSPLRPFANNSQLATVAALFGCNEVRPD
ncbi:hypothetical protein MTO96_022505 [Rhipicephalus appendiculatus]